MNANLAIEAVDVKKTFGKKTAIENISLQVEAGSIHAILGPNGAGKTTFVKILATLLKPNEGVAKVFGHDVVKESAQVRDMISLTGQSTSVDEDMTGAENLILLARLLGYSPSGARQRTKDLLEAFDLADAGKQLVKQYSGGMRRRLDIAASIIKGPKLLFLDEPTTGLDPRSRNNLWSLIRDLARQGTTVLLTTQYLEEADQLADRISVIDQGTVISEGTSAELKNSVGKNILHIQLNDHALKDRTSAVMEAYLKAPVHVNSDGKKIAVPTASYAQALGALDVLKKEDIQVTAFSLSQPSLDEVFLSLTGHGAEEENGQEMEHDGLSKKQNNVSSFNIKKVIGENRPTRNAGIFTNKMMFGWRGLLKIKHIPEQFMDVLITPIMFTFMFTYIFGGAIAGSATAYLQFLIPGILVQTFTFNSMYAGMNINTDITKGIFDRFRSMPLWTPSPLVGPFVSDVLRHAISGAIILLLGLMLGFRTDAGFLWIVGSFLIMMFFATSIAWIFIILGLFLRSSSAVMSVGWLFLMPLVFMSNIFVDPVTMPGWLQTFISYNPLAWQVDAVRSIYAGTPVVSEILYALGASVVITVIMAPLAIGLYTRER